MSVGNSQFADAVFGENLFASLGGVRVIEGWIEICPSINNWDEAPADQLLWVNQSVVDSDWIDSPIDQQLWANKPVDDSIWNKRVPDVNSLTRCRST